MRFVAGWGADEQDAGSGRHGEETSGSRCWLECREEPSGNKVKEKSRRKVLDQPRIFISAGVRGLQIEIAPQDLISYTGATPAACATPDA